MTFALGRANGTLFSTAPLIGYAGALVSCLSNNWEMVICKRLNYTFVVIG